MWAATGAGTASATMAKHPAACSWSGLGDDRRRLAALASLGAVAAQGGGRLRREPDVAHDRDAGGDDRLGAPADVPPRSSFTAWSAALLDETDGGRHGLGVGDLVGAEGQIGDEQRAAQPAAHGAHQHEELVHRDGDGAVVAEHHVGGAVADEHDVDAGGIDDLRRRVVVGGHHHDEAALGSSTRRDREGGPGPRVCGAERTCQWRQR